MNGTSSQNNARANEVAGRPFRLVDNGAWCWYQDERIVLDPKTGRFFIGSIANRDGSGGEERDGDIEVTAFDPASGSARTHTLHKALTSYGAGDDHNVPALWMRPDGGCLAMYTGHNNDNRSFHRIVYDDRLSEERTFDWNSRAGGCDFPATYSNLLYLEGEKRLYNVSRNHGRSPNFAVSEDFGSTWSYGGQLIRAPENIGYVNGYFKYATDGLNRIHFLGTEHHPRDFNTSLYHGYLENGKLHRADGTLVADISGPDDPPIVTRFTPVFAAGTELAGTPMTRAWNLDFRHYPDGRLAALFQTRAADSETDHRFFRAVFDGERWHWESLGAAGPNLFDHEQDYTGCAALDPADPDVICLSAPIDPRDERPLERHELFLGKREANGWRWWPLTCNSAVGNFRPIVARDNDSRRWVFWWRGACHSSQNFNTEIVALLPDAD